MRPGRRIGATGLMGLLVAGCGTFEERASSRDVAVIVGRQAEVQAVTEELSALQSRSTGLTYTATYDLTRSTGETDQIVIAQKPPRSLYRKGSTLLLDDGHRLLSCTADRCQEAGLHDPNANAPGALKARGGVEILNDHFGRGFNPLGFGFPIVMALNPNTGMTRSTREIAGQRSQCFTVNPVGSPITYTGCMSETGIFTFSDDGNGTVVQLVKLEEKADEWSFVPPVPVLGP